MKVLSSVVAAALLTLNGCGRTASDCEACADPFQPSAGAGGASAGSGGSGVTSGTGGSIGGQPIVACAVGAPDVPLVRYSLVDLEQTIDAVVGPGSSFAPEGNERSVEGPLRLPSLSFVEQLVTIGWERALAAPLDAESLQVCEADVQDRTRCVNSWIRERGQQLYRRPLTDEQVAGYVVQFNAWSVSSTPVDAARMVLHTMTLSPYFVFRIELGASSSTALNLPPTGQPPIGAPEPQNLLPPGTLLDPFEVAARLSHFVTRRAPDRELLDSAANGRLLADAEILAQYDRLSATPQGAQGRALQHLEWLKIDDLASSDVGNDGELAQEMRAQTSAFIHSVLQNQTGSLAQLLSRSRLPLNRRLADHYGIDSAVGDSLELVELDPKLFGGILAQGATLSRYGKLTQRGANLVMDRLLCTPIPPPPPSIDFPNLPYMGTTPRERIGSVTDNQPPCSGCHSLFNPIGYALEAFDSQGRLTGFDTTGALPAAVTLGEPVPVDGPAGLGRAIAASPLAGPCAARRYLEYLLDRSVTEEDAPFDRCFSYAVAGGDVDLNYLGRLLVSSDALRRMTRPASNVVAVSSATDPVEHALDETNQLLAAFPQAEQQLLQLYADSLRQWQATLPNL